MSIRCQWCLTRVLEYYWLAHIKRLSLTFYAVTIRQLTLSKRLISNVMIVRPGTRQGVLIFVPSLSTIVFIFSRTWLQKLKDLFGFLTHYSKDYLTWSWFQPLKKTTLQINPHPPESITPFVNAITEFFSMVESMNNPKSSEQWTSSMLALTNSPQSNTVVTTALKQDKAPLPLQSINSQWLSSAGPTHQPLLMQNLFQFQSLL